MRRSAMPPRSARLPRSGIKGRRAPLKASGETKRKKRKRYAAYLRSAAWQAKRAACLERAQGRCEYTMPDGYRCGATADHAHHKTYARFHHELPEDLQALCRMHHEHIEATQFPHRKRGGPEHISSVVARVMDGIK